MTDCTQSRTSERDPVGPGSPPLWGLRTPQSNPSSHACHRTAGPHQCVCTFLCVFACKCGCLPSCVHTRPTGIRCEGGSGAGWVQRGHSFAALQTVFVVARPASMAHMSICMEARIHSLREHTQTTPKNILHTLHSYGLKDSHWGRRLNLFRGKTDCIRKMKGEGVQAHVYER